MLQVYLVGGTQDTHHDSYEFLAKVEEAMQAGITAFQYREKDNSTMTADARLIMARRLVEMGKLAKGKSMEDALKIGKAYVEATIKQGINVGHGHGPLNHWAKIRSDNNKL